MWKHAYLNFYSLLSHLSLQITPLKLSSHVSLIQLSQKCEETSNPLHGHFQWSLKPLRKMKQALPRTLPNSWVDSVIIMENTIWLWCHIPQFVGQKGIKIITLHAENVTCISQKCQNRQETDLRLPPVLGQYITLHSLMLSLLKMELLIHAYKVRIVLRTYSPTSTIMPLKFCH